MKTARMKIFHFRFILFNSKIFGEIVTTFLKSIFVCMEAFGWELVIMIKTFCFYDGKQFFIKSCMALRNLAVMVQ